LPVATSSGQDRTARSYTARRTSALDQPAAPNSRACSGLSTTAALTVSWMSAPVRAIVPARSAASCSGTMVCRASMCTHDLITIAVTALSAAARPNSVCSAGHGLSSSFSAMHAVYLAGVPWVAWSSSCGRRPNALIAPSRIARPMVALARKPEPNTLPLLFRPSRSRTGPLTIRNGAVPVVDCQMARPTYPSATSDSHAASTTGKYSGRHPASAALMAASRTVSSRFRCGIASSTSPGSRSD
jgi:hypothetical protein